MLKAKFSKFKILNIFDKNKNFTEVYAILYR